MKYYTLDDNGKPVETSDLQKWADWFETADLYVASTAIGASVITTKFVPLLFDDDSEHFWETKIMGGKLDQVTDRCSGSREQAQAMHDQIVKRVTTANQ